MALTKLTYEVKSLEMTRRRPNITDQLAAIKPWHGREKHHKMARAVFQEQGCLAIL